MKILNIYNNNERKNLKNIIKYEDKYKKLL